MLFARVMLVALLATPFCMAEATAEVEKDALVKDSVSDPFALTIEDGLILEETLQDLTQFEALDESLDSDEIQETASLPIPEPAAAGILLAGLGSMAWMRYRLG